MNIERTIAGVRAAIAAARAAGMRVALVPTMGALHAGHVALFREARATCGFVVASVFVNPTQFGDPRDLAAYPRDVEADAAIARGAGVELVFAPSEREMYPEGFATWVQPEGAAGGLEGERRPGHFRGVATVCLKLFTIVSPDVAVFGQKDAQQVGVVTQVVRDLNLGIQIAVVPTVRDRDGLALSSRNARLSADERRRALAIPQALGAGLRAFRSGGDPVAAARAALGALIPEYVAVAHFDGQPTLAIAATVGATRLIDNVPLDVSNAWPCAATQEISHGE